MRTPQLFSALVSAAALALAACGPGAVDDKEFVNRAANAGMLEVELGQHAAQHAMDPGVREFAQQMVDDHSKANAELTAIARRQGLPVPTQMDEDHREKLQELASKQGGDFDDAYVDAMVKDHEKAVELFRSQADDAEKSEIDQFAARTLPTIERHLEHARNLNKDLEQARL